MTRAARARAWLVAALAALSVLVVAGWVRPSGELSALLPDEGDARAFAQRQRLFGGGEPGLLLLEGVDADEVARAAETARAAAPGALTGLEPLPDAPPTSWMLLADAATRDELARALSPAGMRARLAETRALLLAPGGAALADAARRDPLRVAELVSTRLRRGPRMASADGAARLVVVPAVGDALDSDAAARGHRALSGAAAAVRAAHPSVSARTAGPHVVAAETEARIRRDVAASSVLSLALSALVFLLVSRNPRLIVSVVPPVLAGTATTAALAALAGGKVSGVAAAFVSVVVGVGMDTGVHAHLAVVDALRAGSPDPVARALAVVARPSLTAAVAAGAAFACLTASSVPALRQLGALAAAGELLTALAVLAWTPTLAVALERGRVDRAIRARAPTRGQARAALGFVVVALAAALALGVGPRLDGPIVALKPPTLEVSRTYARLVERLNFPANPPEFVLLRGANDDELAARAERVADALSARGARVDVPLDPAIVAARRAARDRLDLPARADELLVALREAGFAPARFEAAIADLRGPAPSPPELGGGAPAFAHDDGERVTALRVDAPPPDVRELVAAIDPAAGFGGIGAIERTLRGALGRELTRLLPVCALVVLASLAVGLRRLRAVGVALAATAVSVALTWVTLGALRVPLHVYDALVLPVLFGLTLDETLFLLEAQARGEVARELPRVATTALTTAAGFGALLVCDFPGLRDVGWTGLVGSAAGLVGSTLVLCSTRQGPTT